MHGEVLLNHSTSQEPAMRRSATEQRRFGGPPRPRGRRQTRVNRAAVSLTGLEAAVDPRELDRGFNPLRGSGVLTALLAMFIILFAASAPAQQVMTLVSNLGQTPETPTEFTDVGFHVAQAFTTGSARWGHTVTSVDIGYGDPEGDSFRASIWTVDASNNPDEQFREGIDVESFISWDEPDSSQTGESLLIAVKGKPRGVTATLEAGKSVERNNRTILHHKST